MSSSDSFNTLPSAMISSNFFNTLPSAIHSSSGPSGSITVANNQPSNTEPSDSASCASNPSASSSETIRDRFTNLPPELVATIAKEGGLEQQKILSWTCRYFRDVLTHYKLGLLSVTVGRGTNFDKINLQGSAGRIGKLTVSTLGILSQLPEKLPNLKTLQLKHIRALETDIGLSWKEYFEDVRPSLDTFFKSCQASTVVLGISTLGVDIRPMYGQVLSVATSCMDNLDTVIFQAGSPALTGIGAVASISRTIRRLGLRAQGMVLWSYEELIAMSDPHGEILGFNPTVISVFLVSKCLTRGPDGEPHPPRGFDTIPRIEEAETRPLRSRPLQLFESDYLSDDGPPLMTIVARPNDTSQGPSTGLDTYDSWARRNTETVKTLVDQESLDFVNHRRLKRLLHEELTSS